MADLDFLRTYLKETKDDWNYIGPLDFYQHWFGKRDYCLIDLRDSASFKRMHIKGAKNIYWLSILDDKNLRRLPKDKPIFLICYVGHTSSQILTLLKLLGYPVTAIKYGYGKSPVPGMPVAGWLDYDFPVVRPVGC
jgi:rhodanese-related sulfurtransferase